MKKDLLSKAPELLADLGDKVTDKLCKTADIDPSTARQIACELVDDMRRDWGGQLVYFPKGDSMEILERDLQMYADFNGSNHAQLAQSYNLSVQQVYKRLRLVRESKFAKRQLGLPNLPKT
jgi:Mor family transcriptional regulator